MAELVDPGPSLQARLDEALAPLEAELAAATTRRDRWRTRWRIRRKAAQIRRGFAMARW